MESTSCRWLFLLFDLMFVPEGEGYALVFLARGQMKEFGLCSQKLIMCRAIKYMNCRMKLKNIPTDDLKRITCEVTFENPKL